MIAFKVNAESTSFEGDQDTPLLWVLRDHFRLTGTKYGCGIAQCGACTVHLNGTAVRSCAIRVADVVGQSVRTIEGLADGEMLHPLQQQWIEQDVAQCGYCQAGQIMSAAALLEQNANASDEEIDTALYGNFCRCGTYNRIRAAVRGAARIRL